MMTNRLRSHKAFKTKFESCPKMNCWYFDWLNGPRMGRIRRICSDLICENPSDPSDPWSIHLATQIHATTKVGDYSVRLKPTLNANRFSGASSVPSGICLCAFGFHAKISLSGMLRTGIGNRISPPSDAR